jgi:Fe-S-cluster containining protein
MAEPVAPRAVASANVTVEGKDFKLESRVTVPAGPTRAVDLLPLGHALADAVAQASRQAAVQAGTPVSCKAGCGACCRTLVAISQVEARRLREVVDRFPEPRRRSTRRRFLETLRRLDRVGLLQRLRAADRWTSDEYDELVGVYFSQGIPCPFLEAEHCSIYEERPIVCREYLVTSPAEHCAQVASKEVRPVRPPVRVFNAVARWQVPPSEHFVERWVPLVLALEWADANPDDPPRKPGPELLGELLECLRRVDPAAE